MTAAHAVNLVHVATAAHDAIQALFAIAAHAVIPAHAARAARLVEKEKAKTGDKIRHLIVPTNQYRLIRRSYLTATLAVWYLRFRTSTRQHRSAC